MRTSYSALETFKQCPQKYKFEVIDKIRAPRSAEAIFGSAVHSALKFMFSKNPVFPTAEEILADFSAKWKDACPKIRPALSLELAIQYETGGRTILKNFYKNNPPWNFSVLDTESRFEVPLAAKNGDTHILAGIIDRIDKIGEGQFEIIDYKTNRRLPSQSDADSNLQLSIYHMALMQKWPQTNSENIKLSLYFLKHAEKLSSRRSDRDLSAVKEEVLDNIGKIEKGIAGDNFPAKLSVLCDYCPYKKICPAWKHLYRSNAIPIPSETELNSAVEEYFSIKETESVNEKRAKELQGLIKNYMDANNLDRVFDSRGYFISKKLQQRFKHDLEKVREILVSAGLEDKWRAILEADEKKLKTILPTLPYPIRVEVAKHKFLLREFTVLATSTKPAKK